jgi:hypothetical protein
MDFFDLVIRIDFELHSFYTSLAFDHNSRSEYIEQKREEHAMKKKAGKKDAKNAKGGEEGEQKV